MDIASTVFLPQSSPLAIPDSLFAEIKTIRERLFDKLVSYGLFRASSVSPSILFQSLQEFSTYTENAQGRSPYRNHESHVLDRFHRVAYRWSDGERKERQEHAEDHNQIPSFSLLRNVHCSIVSVL